MGVHNTMQEQVVRKYISLANQGNLTIDDLIKRGLWERAKCDLKFK